MSEEATSIARENPSRAWPFATITLLFLLWLAFTVDYATRAHRGIGPEPLPALWVFDGAHPKPWQWITYAFVHCFRWHLHGNLIVLAPAAMLLEWRVGSWRTLALFFLLTVMVSCGFHLVDPRDLYGASGVATGFITAAAIVWLLAHEKRLWQRAIPCVIALAYLIWRELWPALQAHPNPGWKAHLVGALSGIAVALLHEAAMRELSRRRGLLCPSPARTRCSRRRRCAEAASCRPPGR